MIIQGGTVSTPMPYPLPKDGSEAMTGNLKMGGKKITNLGTPTASTDAATKAYADQMLPKAGGEVTGDVTLHRVNVKPKGEGYAPAVRFLDDADVVRGVVSASSNHRGYIQNNCPDTDYSEYFYTPTPTENRTGNANFRFLTTKEVVALSEGGTGSGTSLADAPKNAIIKKIGDGTSQLFYTETANGAFYATSANGSPQFGTLPIAQGGTGATSAADARTKLGAAASSHEHSTSNITSGTLPLARGGLGRNMSEIPPYAIVRATSNLTDYPYLYYQATGNGAFYATSTNGQPTFGTLPVAQGGTGVTTDAEIGLKAYPVGSIYISYNSTSPASRFGGTWTQIKDRFLLAVGSTYSAAKTGGSATHTLTESEMPSHAHSNNIVLGATGLGTHYHAPATTNNTGTLKNDWTYYTGNSGGGEAHNNMPPYQTVYMWRRTE